MKVKKQRRHRRAVRFYTACFGFREPFKILCDGTFVHHCLTNSITPADTALANNLGASVKMFTTRCVLAELKSLGGSYSDSLTAASNLMIARCEHEKRKSAVACIIDVIGESNQEHFFVATQDAELRKKFQGTPGVPTVHGLRNALFLDRPSTFQQEFAKAAEEQRSHMTNLEYRMFKKRRTEDDEIRNPSADNEEGHAFDARDVKTTVKVNRVDKKDGVQFRRKKAKGPNPLSCKKKKSQGNIADVSFSSDKATDKLTRKRKRKRSSRRSNAESAMV